MIALWLDKPRSSRIPLVRNGDKCGNGSVTECSKGSTLACDLSDQMSDVLLEEDTEMAWANQLETNAKSGKNFLPTEKWLSHWPHFETPLTARFVSWPSSISALGTKHKNCIDIQKKNPCHRQHVPHTMGNSKRLPKPDDVVTKKPHKDKGIAPR